MPKQSKDVEAESVATPKSAGEIRKVAPRKRATKIAARKSRSKKSTAARNRPKGAHARENASAGEPTDEQIRLRAYYLAERRAQFALPGDSNGDWIEARRQLLEEVGLPPN